MTPRSPTGSGNANGPHHPLTTPAHPSRAPARASTSMGLSGSIRGRRNAAAAQQALEDATSRLTVQWHYRGLNKHHTILITGTDPSFAPGLPYYFGLKARSSGSSAMGGARNVGFRITVSSFDTISAPLVTRQKVRRAARAALHFPSLHRRIAQHCTALRRTRKPVLSRLRHGLRLTLLCCLMATNRRPMGCRRDQISSEKSKTNCGMCCGRGAFALTRARHSFTHSFASLVCRLPLS